MLRTLALVLLTLPAAIVPQASSAWLEPYRPVAQRLITESQRSDFAWRRLAELTDTYGHRLSGSETLEQAIDWAVATMKKDGLENVRKEPVMVPKWIRGRESLDLVQPVRQSVPLLALGNSVATPAGGVEADVVVFKSFDEFDRDLAKAKGRIVLFNAPFTNYGETVAYRRNGPSRAAKAGALAMLLRSVGPTGLRTPHTGGTVYEAGTPQIAAVAIATEDADRFQRLQDRGVPIRVKLLTEGHFEPDSQSYNVIGELRGRELPNEILVAGGHIDSWDVGAGASDDGGGCIVTWEALRLMKVLNLHPRRTVRVVLFTNEENGSRGGAGYRDAHQAELANHMLMLESDGGVFDPSGFGFTGPDAMKAQVTSIASLLKSIGADAIAGEGGGTDIEPAATAGKIPMIAHRNKGEDNGQYFTIHHTMADTIARITPKQVSDNAAAIAVMLYVLADMPGKIAAR